MFITIIDTTGCSYGGTLGEQIATSEGIIYRVVVEDSFASNELAAPAAYCPEKDLPEFEKWNKMKAQKEFRKHCKRIK